MVKVRPYIGAAFILFVACTSGSKGGPQGLSPSPTQSTRPFSVRQIITFSSGASSIFSLTGWDHYVAWAESDDEDSPPNRVIVYDLATRKRRVVARATSSKAQLESLVGDQNTLIYAELARTPDTFTAEGANVPWSEYVVDLKTGAKVEILSFRNDRPRHVVLPKPSFEWPWVVETLPGRQDGLDVMAYDVRAKKWKTLQSDIQFGSSFQIDDGLVYYRAQSKDPAPKSYRDLFEVPTDESHPPRQLTSSGFLEGVTTANGATVWHEPIEGDPASMWWLKHGQMAKAHKFRDEGGYSIYPGRNFVVWTPLDGHGLLVGNPLGINEPIQLAGEELYRGAQRVAFGDQVTWATVQAAGAAVEIHVARIVTD